MNFRRIIPALLLLSLAAITAPARADSPFTMKEYAITFSDGWQPAPSRTGNDSTLALIYGYSLTGYCFLTTGNAGDSATSAQIDAFRISYADGDSLVTLAESTAVLGGKTFAMVEYQSADSANADTRLRYYSTTEDSLTVTAVLIFDGIARTTLVPDFETALGTLTFASTPIRAWAHRPFARGPSRSRADILGRSGRGATRMAAFLLP
jgi:hypothetical protein